MEVAPQQFLRLSRLPIPPLRRTIQYYAKIREDAREAIKAPYPEAGLIFLSASDILPIGLVVEDNLEQRLAKKQIPDFFSII